MKLNYKVLGIAVCMVGVIGCSDKNPISIAVAYEDNVTMGVEETSLDIDVLKNDIYIIGKGKELHLELDGAAGHASLAVRTVDEKQVITYIPEDGFEGRDTFGYCIRVATLEDCTRVHVIVGNGEPLVNAGADKRMLIGTPLRVEGSAIDDRDDPDTLTFEWKEGVEVLSSSAVLMYDPALMGQHKLVLTATDTEGATGSDEVNITVNGFNVVDAQDDDVSMPDTQRQLNIDVLDNDSLAGEVSTVTLEIETGPSDGYARPMVIGGKKVISYVPDDGFVGTDTFVYSATIGGVAGRATVTVHVLAAEASNEKPVADDASTTMAVECEIGTAVSFTLTGRDADGDTITFSKVAEPDYGTVVVESDGSGTFTLDNSEDQSKCFDGMPNSFTFKVNDGTVDSDAATVTINPPTSEE
jgi:VCBS repeat-containing protein